MFIRILLAESNIFANFFGKNRKNWDQEKKVDKILWESLQKKSKFSSKSRKIKHRTIFKGGLIVRPVVYNFIQNGYKVCHLKVRTKCKSSNEHTSEISKPEKTQKNESTKMEYALLNGGLWNKTLIFTFLTFFLSNYTWTKIIPPFVERYT